MQKKSRVTSFFWVSLSSIYSKLVNVEGCFPSRILGNSISDRAFLNADFQIVGWRFRESLQENK